MDNVMDRKMIDGDEVECTLRPQSLKEYVGQNELKEMNENNVVISFIGDERIHPHGKITK